jgi:hypothetical protein
MALSHDISNKARFETGADGSDKHSDDALLEEHPHLSVGDMLKGTAVHETTPFERKAALINA